MTNKSAIIKTEFFYKKYCGKIKVEGEIDVLHETEKALLIIEVFEDGSYSTKSWIPKSKIISIEYVNKLPSEVKKDYASFVTLERELGREPGFTYEQYYNMVNKK